MYIGFARTDFTPSLPFPLAGHVTRKDRLAGWVRDPLTCGALTLRKGKKRWALISIDLLIVDDDLYRAVEQRLEGLGIDGFYLNATHTHSSLGGYVSNRGGHLFMGRFSTERREQVVGAIEHSVKEAQSTESLLTEMRRGVAQVPGITMNRRYEGGLTDDRVFAMELTRKKGRPVLIYSVSGHPVIASSFDQYAASGDVPGECTRTLDSEGFAALFVSGPQGALNMLFPEMTTSLEAHLSVVSRLALSGVREAVANATPVAKPDVGFGIRFLDFPLIPPPTITKPAAWAPWSFLTAGIGYTYSRVLAPGGVRAPATVLKVGDVALVGMPADFGVTAARTLRDQAKADHGLLSVVSSQTNGYAGYTHLPEEHNWTPDAKKEFFLYENAMAWHGRDVAQRLNSAALDIISTL